MSDFNNDDFLLIVVSAGNYLNGILVIAVYKPMLSCNSSAPKACEVVLKCFWFTYSFKGGATCTFKHLIQLFKHLRIVRGPILVICPGTRRKEDFIAH